METEINTIKRDINFLKKEIEELKIAVDIEPEIRPEYVKKLRGIEKEGKFVQFDSIDELRESIKNA